MMKKIQILAVLLFTAFQIQAQISTTLNVLSSPTAVLSEWAIKNPIVNFIVDKADPNNQPVIFKTEMKLIDGTVIGVTDVAKATPVILPRGVRVFYSKDVMPLEVMNFSGTYRSTLEKTGKLPSGQYQLCVSILAPGTFQTLVAAKCRNFNLAAIQLPFLMMPANQSILKKEIAQTAITFRWTPVSPQSQAVQTSYRLQVFEVLPHQQTVQALRSNQPLLDITLRGMTQYIWQPRLAFNPTDSLPTTFIWTIQTLDANGLPLVQSDGNGESRSEPYVFKIAATPSPTKRE
jgi:hypothetical protein